VLEEDILSICCDCISYLVYGSWSSLKICWFIIKQDTWFRLLLFFLLLTFHKVVLQHILCVLGSLLIMLLQISCWVCRWKNYENRSLFSENMDKSIVSPFFDSRCMWSVVHAELLGLNHVLYMLFITIFLLIRVSGVFLVKYLVCFFGGSYYRCTFGTVCHPSSVTFCIVEKWHVLAKSAWRSE